MNERTLIRKHCKATDYWCGCCKWSVWVSGKLDAHLFASFEEALKSVQ